jgi:long-chain acyl-CoA synthetase
VSELVATFSRLVDAVPARRLIHVPASGQSLTVQDVWHARGTHADMLRGCGLVPGDLLLLAVGNKPVYASLLLAARELDIAVLAVDSGTPAPEILDLCVRFGVAGCVVAVEHAASLGDLRAALADGLVVVTRQPPAYPGKGRYPGVALLKLTSGSTGVPKAACNSDAQLIVDSQQIAQAMGIGRDDTQIASIPLSHAYGLSVVLIPALLQGTPIVLRESFVPHQLAVDADTYGARVFAGVPFMFDYFLAHPPPEGWPQSLRKLISAGARLMPETVRGFYHRFGIKIHSFYGTSESGGIAFDASNDIAVFDTVGHALPGVTITFRTHEETRGDGRVHIRSGGVANGYAVPTKVGTHEFGETGGDFCEDGFLTGDIGHVDADGRLHLTGRVSSFINVAGKKVQPAEVEDVLREMPGVRDVRVIGGADPQRGELVAACIVLDRGAAPISVLGVRRFCSSRLAPHKIPRVVVRFETLPLTERGKVDRRALDDAVRAATAGFPEQLC